MSEFKEVPANKSSLARRKLVHGVGTNDADYLTYSTFDGKKQSCPYYRTWSNMLRRCYDAKLHDKYPTYIGCSVCDEWFTFSNFKSWMVTQDWSGKALDKDLLVRGNKVYSPYTCLFVSSQVNSLMSDSGLARGEFSIGVCWNKHAGKFAAKCNINGKRKNLGFYLTEEEAHQVYTDFKRELIIITANKETDLKLKDALLRIAHNL